MNTADQAMTMTAGGDAAAARPPEAAAPWRVRWGLAGGILLLLIVVPCVVTLPWSLTRYDVPNYGVPGADIRRPPSWAEPLGSDGNGRSLLWRCLLGGAVSLSIGASSALIAVVIGVTWGMVSGYAGGRTDALMMRAVDVLYGLPYILLVVLLNIALQPGVRRLLGWFMEPASAQVTASVVTLLTAIGGLSWLTMARVIRGQVLSLKGQPFIEAARAAGVGPRRILVHHLLPNLIGPIVVYTTLTVPSAILQESFLSFLGIGVQAPLPSWGNLASEGIAELPGLGIGLPVHWWLVVWPCLLLGLTLLALNLLGEALREKLDPRKQRT